jgi:acyl-CoA reductase-like NAD-dependent aldehyde dehydrogenase
VERIYVHRDVAKPFTEALIAAAAALRMGDPMDPATTLGPLALAAAPARVVGPGRYYSPRQMTKQEKT